MKDKKEANYIVLFPLIIAAFLRFPLVLQNFFAFTYDQGRDLLAVKQIVLEKNLTLIGPTTGLPGIFYGPWWYYFLSPLFLIFHADPKLITFSFSALGVTTIFFLFVLIKKITQNSLVASAVALIAAFSNPFITSSSQMWSPSLVLPLMLVYTFAAVQLLHKPSPKWFLVMGLTCGFIMDSGAAFGIVLTISTISAAVIFRKNLLNKYSPLFLVGFLIILAPRIIFEFKNDFLMSKGILSYLQEPKIYQEKLSFIQRLVERMNIFYLVFSQTFANSNKVLAIVPLVAIITTFFINGKTIIKNKLLQLFATILFFFYLYFSIFPDAVWEYYLVGLPVLFIILFAITLSHQYKETKIIVTILLIALVAISFNKKLLSPFSITWQGDGAIYRNQIRVIDEIKADLKGDYSLEVYTPSRFDYPFDYLIWLYSERGEINKPKSEQKTLVLIIRDDPTHTYLSSGWYGDKTKDRTKRVKRQEYIGSFVVEQYNRL